MLKIQIYGLFIIALLFRQPFSTGSTTYNFYIPIQPTMLSINSIHVVALGAKTNQAYAVSSVYRVAGSKLSNLFINTPAGSDDLTNNLLYTPGLTTQVLIDYTTAPILSDSSSQLVITSAAANMGVVQVDATNGCFGGITSGTAPIQPGLNGATAFRPYALQSSQVVIATSVVAAGGTSCAINAGNSGSVWGQAFIVYMRDRSPFFT